MSEIDEAPALFNHTKRLYESLEAEAVDGIFVGFLTQKFKDLGVSESYSLKLYGLLYKIGWIELIQRGQTGHPSRVRLIKPPTLDDYTNSYLPEAKSRASLLEQRVTLLERRLPNIDLASALIS